MLAARRSLAGAGIALLAFGAFRLLTKIEFSNLLALAGWLVAAIVIHDGLIAPFTVGVGVLLVRVPPEPRRYLQFFLTAAALVTVVAVPLILRRGTQPEAKVLLTQNYAGHLALIVGLLAAVTVAAYAIHFVRGRRSEVEPAD